MSLYFMNINSFSDFVETSGIIAKDALLRLIGQVGPLLKTFHALGDMVCAREVGNVGREHEHLVTEQLNREGEQFVFELRFEIEAAAV